MVLAWLAPTQLIRVRILTGVLNIARLPNWQRGLT